MELERSEFTEMFDNNGLDELFYQVVDGSKRFTELENFLIYLDYDNEQVTILDRNKLRAVSWYKYLHPGRCLEIEGLSSKDEVNEFLKELSEDLKEKVPSNICYKQV